MAQPVAAVDLREWIPGLRITPFLSERVEYETNVFQTATNAQDDVIIRTSPGFLAEWNSGPHGVTAGYRAEILKFFKLSNQDTVQHYFIGRLQLDFGRLRVNVRDDFLQTSDLPPNSELTGRIESTTNTLLSDLVYRVTERFALGANGSWIHASVPSLPQLDRDEYLAGGSVFWKVLPKTDLVLTYNHGEKFFSSSAFRSVTRDIGLVGVRGDITPKLSSTFRIGYEIREPTTAGFTGYRGLVMGGDWIYRPTSRLVITLLTDRSVQESLFGNAVFYVSTSASIMATQQFTKLFASVRLSAGDNSYPTKAVGDGESKFRRDTFLGGGARITYDIQPWWRVGADYSYTRRSSNFQQFSFTDSRIALLATIEF